MTTAAISVVVCLLAGTAHAACYDTQGGMTVCPPVEARQRIQRYADAEGWDRAFLKNGRVTEGGNLCGQLYGRTDKTAGWEFTVRFVYYASSDDIDVANWAMINHQPDFDATWSLYCD